MMHTTTTPGSTANGKVPLNGTIPTMASPDASTAASSGPLDHQSKRIAERENLRNIIAQWNANRLDLFEISEPNEDLEFYGVMRFYFQDAGQKVATKCMRISSTASTSDVIANLIEKFRPDIRMLSVPEYALYEIHENGEERKLADEEMPLLVQLNWHKDDREGRFLLRRMDEKTYLPGFSHTESGNLLNRKLSKREKKEKKKREKKEKAAKNDKNKDSLAEKLYTELPETSFTRSISNPEAVMRRRRQQKLEKKLQQFSQEGGPEAGGTLRIFGESINQDVPYKTILLSTRDTASFAVKEILEKYGKDKEDPSQYCLVQIIVPYVNGEVNGGPNGGQVPAIADGTTTTGPVREYILDDDDCPLIIERSHIKQRGVLTFHIRRRPPDFQPRKRKKKPGSSYDAHANADAVSFGKTSLQEEAVNGAKVMPFMVEVNPDGSELVRAGAPARRHFLYLNVTEVGTEPKAPTAARNTIQLLGPNIQARHCVITHTEGMITVTPCNREAETYVNGTRIYETTILKHGMLVRFGKLHTFKFVDEMALRRHSQLSTGAIMGQHFQQQAAAAAAAASAAQLGAVAEMTSNASYETTFDPKGKVETAAAAATASAAAAVSATSTKSNTESGSQQFNSGSLQRHHTVGSLPRSASAASSHNGAPVAGGEAATASSTMATMRGAPAGASSAAAAPTQTTTMPRKGGDNILPAILEVWEEIEDVFLNMIIQRVDPNQVQFKLCITYTLYMVTRYRASTYFKPAIIPNQRATLLIQFCIKYATLIQKAIQEHLREQSFLAFWLANSSELLHFLKNDRHLSAFTMDSQEILADSIQYAFNGLVSCQQAELREALKSFPDESEKADNPSSTSRVLAVLSNSMQLLRRFRVNAALTIQLFSQLFHYINMWLFNRVIGSAAENLCSRHYGDRLKTCLLQIELWAEKQGLELAAECHLSRIAQTAQFLQAPKQTAEELNAMLANIYKLNSVQLRALFERYQSQPDEMTFAPELVESVIKMARSTTDELIMKEGREIRLEEETDLQLPFLLPEDGYSCDIVCGIPAGLQEFVQSLVAARVCSLTIQPTASGYWTIYFVNFQPDSVGPQQHPPPQPQAQSDFSNEETGKGGQHPEHSPAPSHLSKATASMADMNKGPLQAQFAASTGQLINGQFMGPKGAMPPGMSPLQSPQRPQMMHFGTMLPGGGFAGFNGMRPMPEPDVQVFKLQKSNNGIGLSIVAAQGTHQAQQGIYIKSVVKGGAADLDGRLEAGDQLLKVDGHSLIGIDQAKAAELMTQTGPIVTLEVAKQGAVFHGLADMLNQQASAANLMKQAAMRPRFVPNTQGQYGAIRMNGPPHMAHLRAGMPVNANGAPFPAYNTLPVSMSYQQMAAAAAATRGSLPHGSNLPAMRSDSQLSFNSQSKPIYEERHYQNIQLYQLNPRTGSPISGSAAQLPTGMAQQNLMLPPASRQMLHGSHSSLQPNQLSEPGTPQTPMGRPVSQLVTSREQEQIFTSNGGFATPGTPTTAVARHNAMMHSASATGPEFFNYPPPQQGQQYGQLQSPQRQLDLRQRQDLMRQEAKMEEIREELRRREDRLQQPPGAAYMGTIPRGMSLSNSAINPSMPPPGSGNAIRQPNRFVSQQTLLNGGSLLMNAQSQSTGTLRQPGQISMARSSGPPAPAPKPSRPNNFGQQQQQQQPQSSPSQSTQISYRYGPSGYPPPVSQPTKSSATGPSQRTSGGTSPSPWEREEKEKEIQQKLEDTKRSRDEEIKYLESLPYRNPKNEERLKSLILERDFQRRADEHLDDEEDEEMLERADHRERMMGLQQDIERTRQRRLEQRYGDQMGSDGKLNKTLEEQEERLKLLRLEEEAAQQAEERLLQEAKKRQEEEFKVGGLGGSASKGILKVATSTASYNYADAEVPPPLPNSPPPLESANQRLDRLLLATVPKPAEGDEAALTLAPPRSGVLKNSNGYNGDGVPGSDRSVKKVSWNDNPSTTVLNADSDHSEEEEAEEEEHAEDTFSLQDIDDVLGNQASSQKDWLSNYVSGSTPGVIGAQEVYNDPRKRIEAERLKSNMSQAGPDKVPEKLSFAEKMKMFAKTSGAVAEEENNQIRSKAKTSKAQREIEGRPGAPLTNGDLNGR